MKLLGRSQEHLSYWVGMWICTGDTPQRHKDDNLLQLKGHASIRTKENKLIKRRLQWTFVCFIYRRCSELLSVRISEYGMWMGWKHVQKRDERVRPAQGCFNWHNPKGKLLCSSPKVNDPSWSWSSVSLPQQTQPWQLVVTAVLPASPIQKLSSQPLRKLGTLWQCKSLVLYISFL